MKSFVWTLSLLVLASCSAPQTEKSEMQVSAKAISERPTPVTPEDRFAVLALDCVHREYPNKISHVMQSAADAQSPSALTPAFYGCFDWHSSVHGHWLLSRLLNTDPDGVFSDEIRTRLAESFTEEKLAGELDFENYEALLAEAWQRGDGKSVRLLGAGVRFKAVDSPALPQQLEMF